MNKKSFLYTTEKERRESGYTIFGCDLKAAKSKKHATDYSNKLKKYRLHIQTNNINWIDIYTASRGKYKYKVCADCVEGFNATEYRYTPEAMETVKSFLATLTHQTACYFSTERGNAVVYANFTTMEDAEAFAQLLSNLPLKNETLEREQLLKKASSSS